MTTIEYTRQKDWFDPATAKANVTIVGCGGIGSFAAFALAKLGVQQLRLLDFDTVEAHNIPNQMFSPWYVGSSKVGALRHQLTSVEEGSDLDVEIYEQTIADGVPLSDVVVAGLDSMTARKELWNQVRLKPRVKLFLDGRLSAQRLLLYSVNPMSMDDIRGYEATLYSDEEADETSCTGRAIIDVGFSMASLISRAVRQHYTGSAPIPLVYMDQETLDLYKGDWTCR